MSAGVAGQPVRLETFPQQLYQLRGGIKLSLSGNLLRNSMGHALDQNAENAIGVDVALANHADHLGEDMDWIRPVGGNALHPANQFIHSSKRTVCHQANMDGYMGTMQPLERALALRPAIPLFDLEHRNAFHSHRMAVITASQILAT